MSWRSPWTSKCRRCGIKYGNNLVKGANTPAGKQGMCQPCWRDHVLEKRAKKVLRRG